MTDILLGLGLLILILNFFLLFKFKIDRESLLNALRDEFSKSRTEQTGTFTGFSSQIVNTITALGNLQKNQLETFASRMAELTQTLTNQFKDNREELIKSLEKVRETLDIQLKELRDENSKKLDEMRKTVDEKLQDTLEKRLTESFRLVSERLEQVHKGLGEMQHLATGVGDLKKILSNVKTKGIIGEVQLEKILDQILTPNQFAKEVKTKKGSNDKVEFAIKLPGKDDTSMVYLPIDSKFPTETYYKLIDAYESGNAEQKDKMLKELENNIKTFAKDIKDKYIDPPHTTDFAIMFLPTEGLYAEVIKNTNLIEELQVKLKVIVTGPTTLSAFLNSLQLGFKTLAVEKRATEVWNILGAVKTEFNKFGTILKQAKEKIDKASEEIETLVGTRTRVIQSKLRQVESLPEQISIQILDQDRERLE